MNILIIGNGFDLAHGLPNTYKDFLLFVNTYQKYKEILKPDVYIKSEWEAANGLEKDFLLYLGKLCDQKKSLFAELAGLIENNQWIEHFSHVQKKEGWIDFESEISKIIQTIDTVRIGFLQEKQAGNTCWKLNQYQRDILKGFLGEKSVIFTMKTITDLKDKLLADLNRLTRCLEIYLSDYVNKIPVEIRLPDIQELKIDKVLSFNYTNTYKRLYANEEPDIEYDYIHGEAKSNHDINSCNLVLGIDEYLSDGVKDTDNEFIQFKKFYQRIFKRTGCIYLDWVKEYLEKISPAYATLEPEEFNIYVFGHSLDITDKDILRNIMLQRDVKTTIFHFSQNALGNQISNLVKVIGQDNLISMVHGEDARVILKEQRKGEEQ